jgi:hypothetical protein
VRFNILRSAAKLLDDERMASNVKIDAQAYAEHADQIEQFIGSTAESSLSPKRGRDTEEQPPAAKRQKGTSRRIKRKGNRRFTRRK